MNKCLRIAKPQAAEVAFTSEAFPYDDNNCCAGPKGRIDRKKSYTRQASTLAHHTRRRLVRFHDPILASIIVIIARLALRTGPSTSLRTGRSRLILDSRQTARGDVQDPSERRQEPS
jgi:hypothetical protein